MTTLKLPRRKLLRIAAGAAALPVLSRITRAQAYPSRPLRCIVGYAPGRLDSVISLLKRLPAKGAAAQCWWKHTAST
jgi:hypothetical protein